MPRWRTRTQCTYSSPDTLFLSSVFLLLLSSTPSARSGRIGHLYHSGLSGTFSLKRREQFFGSVLRTNNFHHYHYHYHHHITSYVCFAFLARWRTYIHLISNSLTPHHTLIQTEIDRGKNTDIYTARMSWCSSHYYFLQFSNFQAGCGCTWFWFWFRVPSHTT